MKEWLADAAVDFVGDVRARVRRSIRGYERASNVALDLLQRHIDELATQVKSGGTLSKQDHYHHARLVDIKIELERELDKVWEGDLAPRAVSEKTSRSSADS